MNLTRYLVKLLLLALTFLGPISVAQTDNLRAIQARSQLLSYQIAFNQAGGVNGLSTPGSKPAAGAIAFLADRISAEFKKPMDLTASIVKQAYAQSLMQGLPFPLILAVIEKESGFDPTASNRYGAMGLMQVVPRFHRNKLDTNGSTNLFMPAVNLQVGSQILKEYLDWANGNVSRALKRYSGNSRGYPAAVEKFSEKYLHLDRAARAAHNLTEFATIGARPVNFRPWSPASREPYFEAKPALTSFQSELPPQQKLL